MPIPRIRILLPVTLYAIVTAAAASPSADWVDTGTPSQIENAQPRALSDRTVTLQAAPQQMRLAIGIVLQPADTAAMQRTGEELLARNAIDPTLQAQLKAQAAPSKAQLQKVQDYLLSKGITDQQVTGNGSLIQANASVAAIQAAFDVSILTYQINGKTFYVNDGAAKVPTALAGLVGGILGLDNVRTARLPEHNLDQSVLSDSQSVTTQSTGQKQVAVLHQVEDLPALYNASSLPVASDTTVAVIAVGNLKSTLTHLSNFQRAHNLATKVTVVKTANSTSQGYSETNDEIEWDMDTQLVLGTAGGLKNLIIYDIPDFRFSSMIQGIQRAVDDNSASLISFSMGGREDYVSNDLYQALNTALNQAVSNGQNLLIASGDDGIYKWGSSASNPPYYASLKDKPAERAVTFPGSHPYAITVGATELYSAANSSSTYVGEIAWNAQKGGQITQGGFSKAFSAPKWQQQIIPDIVANGHRAVPDISFNGSAKSSALILGTGDNGKEIEEYVFGTSAAAPTFAGLLARVEQANGKRLGFIAPALYAYAQKAGSTSHDVLYGTNGLYEDGYRAGTGFDLVSGWGSLDMAAFQKYLKSH